MVAFTAGNIVVYRIGGTGSAAAAAFLDEYNAQGTLVQEIALPTTTVGAQDAFTDSGQATYSGEITESGTGAILAAAYDATTGTASVSSSTVPRVIGVVSANGTIDTSTTTTSYSGQRFTSAASADGTNIYVAAGNGVGYTTAGSTGAAVALTTTTANQVAVVNGQLYYSTPTATAGIYALGTGLPTTAGQTSTLVAASTKPVAFAFATLGTGTAPDTLYVADNTNGIEKFSLSGGTPPYTMTGKVTLAGADGLSVSVSGGVATLYVTATSGGVSTLQSIVDTTGAGGTLSATPTPLVTAASGSVFKGDVVYQAAACFATGTLIGTARGDVAVENLLIGDFAVTASGAHRPIRWIGHQNVDCGAHPRPEDVMPVRIAAHAFAPNHPARDLHVSPGHAICVDVVEEVLIPANALLNGTTIRQVEVDHITYWHVELDSHDVQIADGLPAESYLDMGNRGFFREADVVTLDALPDASPEARTHADFCRPYHDHGPIVEAVRCHLRARRTAIGWTLAHDDLADLHLIVDGARIEPAVRDLTARFAVPAGARNVWLVSDVSRPCELSDSRDARDLGLCLTGLSIDDGFGATRGIDLFDPLLCVGFHAAEDDAWRWTAGRARLPAALWDVCPEGFFLRATLARPALPRWIAPADADDRASMLVNRQADLHLAA